MHAGAAIHASSPLISRYDSTLSCTIKSTREINPLSSHFRVPVKLRGQNRSLETAAMIDSGATAAFLDINFVRQNRIPTYPLRHHIRIHNIDGTNNKAGHITRFTRLYLTVDGHEEFTDFLITDLGGEGIILGLPWLRKTNPEIDWEKGCLQNRTSPNADIKASSSPLGSQPQDTPSLCRISASTDERRHWVCEGILEDESEEVWCAAGFTYSQQIAEQAYKAKAAEGKTTVTIPESYKDYARVFSEEESFRLPEHKPWDHAIDFIPGAPGQIKTKIYPLSPNEQAEVDRFLKEHLEKGYIRPSKSPIAAPVFFVKKKDGGLRFIQDYRRLNEITVKNRYPLPLISDIINRLRHAKYFTKLDVRWGYNNIRIKEGDEWKAAFATNRGLFEPLVMFFGLTNSPATFQTLMNNIFSDLITEGKVSVYLDDILIFTITLEEHRAVVREVLRRLGAHDLFLRLDKCEFEKEEVDYLGLVIRQGQVSMDPDKVRAITDWPTPKNLRDVRGFLGFCNFYRRFIKDFSTTVQPLNELTRKDVPWQWGEAQQTAFDTLRKAFTTAPILAIWDPNRPTRIETDASGFATGGTLSQKLDDGLWHPIAYRSASMQPAERNYEIYDREMLAIIEALKDWRHYLEGLPKPFEIITDHANLEYWRTAQDLSRRQARWSLFLSRFDFRLTHRPGKANTQADALSRLPQHRVSDAEDNQQQVVLPPERFAKLAANIIGSNPLEDRIRNASQREAIVLDGLAQLKKNGPRRLTNGLAEWEESNGLVYYKGHVYVPADDNLRRDVVKQCHDDPTSGHPGIHATVERVSQQFWWPTLRSFVKKYVEGCDICSRRKHIQHPNSGLQPLDVPHAPWESIGVDLITQLPEAHDYDAIIVFTDHFTKQIHALPCTSDITSEGVADILYREIFRLHGLPLRIVSDRGPQFASKLMRTLLRRLGIQSNLTTAYHPQANGQTERANQEVEKYLRLYVSHRQDDWDEHLPMAEFVINSKIHSAHNHTPFEAAYGYTPLFNIPVGDRTGVLGVDERIKQLDEVRKDIESALRLDKAQQRASSNPSSAPEIKEGDYVWLSAKDIRLKVPTRKLADLQLGPYKVLERIGERDYRLDLPPSLSRLHPVFHIDKLTLWKGNDVNGILPPPPEPVELDGELEYEVHEILDSQWVGRGKNRKLKYLVNWKGYTPKDDTWEPEDHLKNAQKLIKEFHRRHPSAPQRIKASVWQSLNWQPIENFTTPTPTTYSWETGRRLPRIIEDDEA